MRYYTMGNVFLRILSFCRTAWLPAAAFLSLSFTSAPSAPPGVTFFQANDMSFGMVVAGTTGRVLHTDPGAASFRIWCSSFTGNPSVGITFTLPAEISAGGDSFPVSFGASDAAWSYSNNPATATTFNPHTGTSIPKNGNNFVLYLWLGATVNPPGITPSNQYSNTLTIDAQVQ